MPSCRICGNFYNLETSSGICRSCAVQDAWDATRSIAPKETGDKKVSDVPDRTRRFYRDLELGKLLWITLIFWAGSALCFYQYSRSGMQGEETASRLLAVQAPGGVRVTETRIDAEGRGKYEFQVSGKTYSGSTWEHWQRGWERQLRPDQADDSLRRVEVYYLLADPAFHCLLDPNQEDALGRAKRALEVKLKTEMDHTSSQRRWEISFASITAVLPLIMWAWLCISNYRPRRDAA
jgi:hypothetical protein